MPRTHLSVGLLALLVTACSAPPAAGTETPTATLRPFTTATRTPTPTNVPLLSSVTPEELLPTATPFVHQVEQGETLLDIALEYGLSLDQLLAANPGIDPHFLSIGQELTIPGPEGELSQALLPTSTPLPLKTSDVFCDRAPSETIWCIVTVTNDRDSAVEGLTATVTLIGQDGRTLASQVAYAPLNRLPAGARMPLMASFGAEITDPARISASLLSAVESGDAAGRYLPVEVSGLSTTPLLDGRRWRVEGGAQVEAEEATQGVRVSILAVGLSGGELIVGFTKWEPEDQDPTQPFEFEIFVQSLGPPLEAVELLAEAAPVAEE